MRRIAAIIVLLMPMVVTILAVVIFTTGTAAKKGQIMNEEQIAASGDGLKELSIKVVYDNNPSKEGLGTSWGFAAVVAGAEKTILFDTGGDGTLLLSNMKKLDIEPNSVDVVVLSHVHPDHTGGLASFLEKNGKVTVYALKAFAAKFAEAVRSCGAKMVEVEQPVKICEDVYSTGQVGRLLKEQALVVRTEKGLVVITGCAHPGIVKMVSTAKELMKEDILLVMGGFHLEWATAGKVEKIVSSFEELGVRYVGPCHCTGHKARDLFEKRYGDHYISVGVGKVISLADLQ